MNLRKSILFTVVLLIAASGVFMNCSDKPSSSDLIGFWKGSYNGRDFIVQFKDTENFAMSIIDQTTTGKYKADFTQEPIQLAIVNQYGVNEKIIVEFIDKEHIRFQSGGPDKPFPETFDHARSFVLRRVADGKI